MIKKIVQSRGSTYTENKCFNLKLCYYTPTNVPLTGVMIELLQKNKIRAAQTNDILMKVISNPVDKYLPPGGQKIGFSVAGNLVNMREFASGLVPKEDVKNAGRMRGENGSSGEGAVGAGEIGSVCFLLMMIITIVIV